jgi:hypothetical protein
MKVSAQKFSCLASIVAVAVLAGCGRAEFAFNNPTSFGQTEPPTVCVPGGTSGSSQNGLTGSIKYLDSTQVSQGGISSVDQLLAIGHDAGVNVVLNQLNVPTTIFTNGFYDSVTGAPLKTSSGTTLIEWFALDLYSDFALTSSDAEGYYQFALLADDGAIINLDETQTKAGTALVNDDGQHPTQMGCGAKAIHLARTDLHPIHVKYYQGPRDHIALTLIWRKVAAISTANDATCGQNGNTLFWDPSVTPSAPTSTYNDLISRGWKVPAPANFILPSGTNPC